MFCGTGGRIDHELGNLSYLTRDEFIGKVSLILPKGETLSFSSEQDIQKAIEPLTSFFNIFGFEKNKVLLLVHGDDSTQKIKLLSVSELMLKRSSLWAQIKPTHSKQLQAKLFP